MLEQASITAFGSLLEKPSTIAIITHIFPDADALGSSLGLAGILKSLNHSVSVIIPNSCPEYLKWMPEVDKVIVADSNVELVSQIIKSAEIIFILDLSQRQRMGAYLPDLIDASSAHKIIMDHHPLPQDFGTIYLHNTQAAATAEIVYRSICSIGKKSFINKDNAECLYAGLVTDTGSFRHPSTTSESHRVAADLIDIGANVSSITEHTQEGNSIEKIQFLSHVVSNNLTIYKQYNAAYVVVTESDLSKFKLRYEDTECILPQIMGIKGVNIAILVKKMKDVTKLSLRSKGNIAVNSISLKYFNGGGHKNAAGGTFFGSFEELTKKIEDILHQEL